MLREVGKRDRPRLERFLVRHQAGMPRTMLHYAIEHLPAQQRRRYLQGNAGMRSVSARTPCERR
jgi:DNA alkylation repair enzyme